MILTVYSLFVLTVFPGFFICLPNNIYFKDAPYFFGYNVNDVLNIDILMINKPNDMTFYIYISPGIPGKKFTLPDIEGHIQLGTVTLKSVSYTIDLELRDGTSTICTVIIAEGKLIDYQNSTTIVYNKDCLNDGYCTILVDFNKCPYRKNTTNFHCSKIDFRLSMCAFENHIGYMPNITSKISKYLFFLEDFDNNTFVGIEPNKHKIVMQSKIREDKNVSILLFNDTTQITFDCEEYKRYTKHLYVGLINTTENKITTMSDNKITIKYNKVYNASILCCIYYTKSENTPETYITRYVENKTMLLFYYNLPENNSISVNTAEDYTAKTSFPQNHDIVYIAIIIVLTVLLLFLTLSMIKKIFCKKTSENLAKPESVELNTIATSDGVLYTAFENKEKDFRKQEEPNYAEIVGVLNPFKNGNLHVQFQ
ncbi:uncharacterized protein LOC124643873 isoform X2 [Helicoverpa zea]|uniref:uncharacterized protein LOC124643873 isoform X2 n=1 Tax=Helicoverpa zea TaxID=7113 RepID=UPI001F56C3E8|nr:uncharacterized protein LOC124643873 isoform X2 [Helicoverpa zea]